MIGHLRPFGEPPSEEICSRYYDSDGNTLDYVYELSGDTLTIWPAARAARRITGASSAPMAKQSPESGSTPGGGGYGSTMSRS